jgi:hypothetical protein
MGGNQWPVELARSGRTCSRRFTGLGSGDPHGQDPGDPKEKEVEAEKGDEANLASEYSLDSKPDQIRSEIAHDHEGQVIHNEQHGIPLRVWSTECTECRDDQLSKDLFIISFLTPALRRRRSNKIFYAPSRQLFAKIPGLRKPKVSVPERS